MPIRFNIGVLDAPGASEQGYPQVSGVFLPWLAAADCGQPAAEEMAYPPPGIPRPSPFAPFPPAHGSAHTVR